ncbi:SIMPL domain-containing protein [Thiomicrolovo sp. ZZH C-3]
MQKSTAAILGLFIFLGLGLFGYLLSTAALTVKGMERVVTVKGLAEREVSADKAIWPIKFDEAGNDLGSLYATVERKSAAVTAFLKAHGFSGDEITVSPPSIVDRQAQNYGNTANIAFRYTAATVVTVYTEKIDAVRQSMKEIADLGKDGIALSGQNYQHRTQFLFTGLNSLKPSMIEEATRNARVVAEKFAKDSASRLGKIKTARQGQFSITDRDSSTPYIKKVRIVSTVSYYLSD